MPAIFRLDGYRSCIYGHEPAEPTHVHVDEGGAPMAILMLNGVSLAATDAGMVVAFQDSAASMSEEACRRVPAASCPLTLSYSASF